MSGIRFQEPGEPERDQTPAEAPERRSWLPVLLIAGLGVALVGGMIWIMLPKDSRPPAATAEDVLSQPLPSFTNRQADAQAEPSEKPYDGPPKFTMQLLDTDEHTCPTTFTESIVVPRVEGEVDSITAVVRVPYDKIERSRELYEYQGEWSTVIGGLPTKRTVKLLVIARGPGGKKTVAEDISHVCPGKPVDRPDPMDLGTKIAKKKIRENMFDFDFEFESKRDRQGSRDR